MNASNNRKFLRLVIFLAIGLWVAADTTIDQQQPIIDGTVGGLAIGGYYNQSLAQIVTAGMTGSHLDERFPIAGDSGNLVIEIQGVGPEDKPNGVVLTSQAFDSADYPSQYPSPPTLRSFRFSTPVPFSAGDRFAIVLSASGDWGIFQGPPGNPYPGGDAWYCESAWPAWMPLGTAAFDLPFQTVVGESYRHVDIDIKPDSFPNALNTKSNGVIPVAVLTTTDFQAGTVDPKTVRFGANGTEAAAVHWAMEDVNNDGNLDLILHFKTQETRIQYGDIAARLSGYTYDGVEIRGSDSIKTVK